MTKAVNDVLGDPDCANFARSILQEVASKKNPVHQDGGDLADVASAFLNQKNKVPFDRNLPDGSAGGANPSGNIQQGNAMIHMSGTRSQVLQGASYMLSEIFHHAGRNAFYTDKELAVALHNTPYASYAYTRVGPAGPMWISPEMNVFDPRYKGKFYWSEKNQLAYSAYFHTIQANICRIGSSFVIQQ